MEVKPLKSLYELLFWTEPLDLKPVLENLINLQLKSPAIQLDQASLEFPPRIQTKTLVCHDDGGYHEDRFCNGCSNDEAYQFYHWSCIDIFVYFSHYFITIPPVGWIQTAHTHGVKVFGTVITEWEEGSAIWEEIFEDDEIIETAINNLVKIACTYKFDGWLLNIENKVKPEKVTKLVRFVKELTQRMHADNPNAEVIWYDSVTCEGDLKWQNELNSLNSCFFDVCDGIFLNYSWDEECLVNSVEAAKERKSSVYVGMDVYGRNFIEGGGYNLHKALQLIWNNNLSVAIFAQSWTYYELGTRNYFSNENILWNTLRPYLLYHGTATLPLNTSFCQGFGKKKYENGHVVKSETWFNLSQQQIQPLWDEFSRLKVPFSIRTEYAFSGGSCVLFWLDKEINLRLLLCEIAINGPLEFEFAYKMSGPIKRILFSISIQHNKDEPSNWKTISFLCEEAKKEELPCDSIGCLRERSENSWTVKTFSFKPEDLTKGAIREIKLCGKGSGLFTFGNLSVADKKLL